MRLQQFQLLRSDREFFVSEFERSVSGAIEKSGWRCFETSSKTKHRRGHMDRKFTTALGVSVDNRNNGLRAIDTVVVTYDISKYTKAERVEGGRS